MGYVGKLEEGMNEDGTREYDVTVDRDIVVDTNVIICPNCRGYGEVEMSYRSNFYETKEDMIECDLCKGSGILVKTELVRYGRLNQKCERSEL